jgi:hypothetical protein
MKVSEVARLVNASQPAISKCLLKGEEIIKRDAKELNLDQFLKEVIIS